MRNKIKSTTFIVMSVFLLLFCYDNANAVDVGSSNCTANSSATFNFNVQPAITIVATNPVLENLCPGCGRSWECGEGPYIQWDVTGSLDCRYNFFGGRVVHCVGDNNASIRGCWMQLAAAPDTWEDIQFDNPRTFFNNNGQGFGKFRYYLTSQAANCYASGNYCWCIDATVDYVCGLIEIQEEPCPTCPKP
jgi:hypothetical protein